MFNSFQGGLNCVRTDDKRHIDQPLTHVDENNDVVELTFRVQRLLREVVSELGWLAGRTIQHSK